MPLRIDLIWLGQQPENVSWPLGEVRAIEPTVIAAEQVVTEHLDASKADAWLFWDSKLGQPDPNTVATVFAQPGDVWHAGLRLGMSGMPGLIDFISPTWMLNCDPHPSIEATSWRLSLRACLVRTVVLRKLGGAQPQFRTLEGAALEMGHRFVVSGALTRHIPWLVPGQQQHLAAQLPFDEELRFAYYRHGAAWSKVAWIRAISSGYVSAKEAAQSWRSVFGSAAPAKPRRYAQSASVSKSDYESARISVLIPTLDRYPYLETLLGQLRNQTIRPVDIVIIDQTAIERRVSHLAEEFKDLPLKILFQDKPGQCASRNAGLRAAEGDYILFLDDDVEIDSDLIEAHLKSLFRHRAGASSGVARETGAGPLPEMFTYCRASDVFPTGNTMIKKGALLGSGLFDLAYDRGQRADGDLGMRVYLSGALMVLDPEISVLHHHAPSGGLRAHKARVTRYASSRNSLTERHLPSATEIYLAMRYFTPQQVRQDLFLRVLGTFSIRGGMLRKACKAMLSSLLLPATLRETWKRRKQTLEMLKSYPQIPNLEQRDRDERALLATSTAQ